MPVSERLSEIGVISSDMTKATAKVADLLFEDIFDIELNMPSNFISEFWARYEEFPERTSSLSGNIFELLIATMLFRKGIQPVYIQPILAFVPNVKFDFVIYTRELGPVVLSAKTSLRERYKQADLEGMMLRQVHRKAKSYLITLDEREAKGVLEKIKTGQVLGLDDVVVASANCFDQLVEELSSLESYRPEPIEVINSVRVLG